jgi:glycerate kinase
MALAAGMRGAGLEAEELPVADGGESTAEVFAATLGGGTAVAGLPHAIRSVAWSRRGISSWTTGRRWSRRRRRSGCGCSGRRSSIRSASSRGLGELLLAIAGEASGRILIGLGDTAIVDGGAGLLEVVGEKLGGASPSSVTSGTHCSASAAPRGRSGRRRAPRPSRSKSWSGD